MAATVATVASAVAGSSSSKPSYDQLKAMVEALEKRNQELQIAKQRKISLKVSEKGAISAYGMGRFPVTLYHSQWQAIVEYVAGVDPSAYDETPIGKFAAANRSALAVKE